LPPSAVQAPPGLGGFIVVEFAKPLKADDAAPLLKELDLAHRAPQNVT